MAQMANAETRVEGAPPTPFSVTTDEDIDALFSDAMRASSKKHPA